MDALLNILLLNMQYNLPPVHRTPTQSTRRQRRDERRPRLPPRPPALPTSGKYNGALVLQLQPPKDRGKSKSAPPVRGHRAPRSTCQAHATPARLAGPRGPFPPLPPSLKPTLRIRRGPGRGSRTSQAHTHPRRGDFVRRWVMDGSCAARRWGAKACGKMKTGAGLGLWGKRLTGPVEMMMPQAQEEDESEEFPTRDTILSSPVHVRPNQCILSCSNMGHGGKGARFTRQPR